MIKKLKLPKKPFTQKYLDSKPLERFSKYNQKNQDISFIGFKKAFYDSDPCIVCLYIPKKAIKRGFWHDKIRVSEAKVLWIQSIRTGKYINKAYSSFNSYFFYKVGKTVIPKRTFIKSNKTCASGIHLFLSKSLAESYYL